MSAMAAPVANIPRVINFARAQDLEVIFLRFLGYPHYQLPNIWHEDTAFGKHAKYLKGTWGAELHASARPAAGERIFTKQACFNTFLAKGFERYLANRKYEQLEYKGV